ncbi:HTTM domain-containing protein [Streptomyces sp. G44]|uniref:HTTM domain-containing protein n=1 Tax=Streptomyces sp. G44 TaxID=2807632 RepID=UPI001960BA5E|nr:HTTM domain-containing protein [Streptomyces sp. G44]MBM7167595.1 HTTM domain-containing protein [Streptomyces sp. G44]
MNQLRTDAISAGKWARSAFYSRLDDFTGTRRSLIGAALTRIVLGAVGVYFYLRDYLDRGYLWGPDGVWPWQNFMDPVSGSSLSLYSLSRSEVWFELVFHTGALVAVLFMLGWRTRVMTVAHYVFLWSLQQRNPMLMDGGDNVAAIVLVFMIFIDSGARLSLDARNRKGGEPALSAGDSMRYRIVSLLHHAGLMAVTLQVCTVYLVSGMYKVQGEHWQDGTALYYILRVNEFGWPGVNHILYENSVLVVLMTYGTVFFQLAFAFLLLNRTLRPFAVAGGVLMHLGIAIHMAGLITFSLTMIGIELLIMGDDHYLRLRKIVRRYTAKGTAVPATTSK